MTEVDDLRHLDACPENPRTETYRAGDRVVARCLDCGAQVVTEAATPNPVAAVFDPERNPNHPAAGVTMRQHTYDDLADRASRRSTFVPYHELARAAGIAPD